MLKFDVNRRIKNNVYDNKPKQRLIHSKPDTKIKSKSQKTIFEKTHQQIQHNNK